MKHSIVTSHTISHEVIATINTQRREVFGDDFSGDFEIDPTPTNNRLFMLVEDGHDLKAFGTLQSVQLTISDVSYVVRGIGNIVAIERGGGFGRYLMESIRTYLQDTEQIGLGFCAPHLVDFYNGCGYTVTTDYTSRFRFQDDTLNPTSYVLWFDPIGDFDHQLRQSQDFIYSNQPFW